MRVNRSLASNSTERERDREGGGEGEMRESKKDDEMDYFFHVAPLFHILLKPNHTFENIQVTGKHFKSYGSKSLPIC